MIRKKKEKKEIIIDLTGPDGNAFVLMGYANRLSRQIGIDPEPILAEMQSGDYENLVEVFDKNFGSFVILER
jgi:hypothetical protein|tara:strand:+ start:1027 stop:1242 length:216 start_codon:yes stop_codon:yes gene_type:complete